MPSVNFGDMSGHYHTTWHPSCTYATRLTTPEANGRMLFCSLIFVVLSVLAAMFSFEIAATSFTVAARFTLIVFVLGFAVSLAMHLKRRC